jgi:hypothetical protein
MTRDYAAVQLLKLGPLTYDQFRYITCWTEIGECDAVLQRLREQKIVKIEKARGFDFFKVIPERAGLVA